MKKSASAVFKATNSRNATIWGIIIAALIDVPLIIFLILGSHGPSIFVILFVTIFVVISGSIIYFTLAARKLSYEIGQNEFKVNFSPFKLKTPFSLIASVEVVQLTLLIRIFGGSWPGLHWGLFKSNKGNVSVYATKAKGDFVVISLVNGKKIAITPEDPEAFVKRINYEQNRFGTMAAKDVEVLTSFSKKLIYAQVVIVIGAFLVFLTYFVWVYPSLPEFVPVHFGFNWVPNRFAHKSELLWVAALAALFPVLNAVFSLKFGKYSKALLIFLGAIFVLVEGLFFSILYIIQSIA